MSFYKRMFLVAIPLTIQQLIFSSVNLLDTLMIGQLSEVAIAAVGLSNQFYFVYNLLLFGLSSGGAIFIAQYWGAKESGSISKTTALMLMVAFLFLFPFFILAVFFPSLTLRLFTPDPQVIQLAVGYMQMIGFTLLPAAISYVFYSVLRSTEHAFAAMAFSAITMCLNAFLNWVFIFGLFWVARSRCFWSGIGTPHRQTGGVLLGGRDSLRKKNARKTGLYPFQKPDKSVFQALHGLCTTRDGKRVLVVDGDYSVCRDLQSHQYGCLSGPPNDEQHRKLHLRLFIFYRQCDRHHRRARVGKEAVQRSHRRRKEKHPDQLHSLFDHGVDGLRLFQLDLERL